MILNYTLFINVPNPRYHSTSEEFCPGCSTNMLTPTEESGKQGREEEPERWIYLQNMSNGDVGHISKGKDPKWNLLLGSFILHFRWQFLSRGGWSHHKTKDPLTLWTIPETTVALTLAKFSIKDGWIYLSHCKSLQSTLSTHLFSGEYITSTNSLIQQIFTTDLLRAAHVPGCNVPCDKQHKTVPASWNSEPNGQNTSNN